MNTSKTLRGATVNHPFGGEPTMERGDRNRRELAASYHGVGNSRETAPRRHISNRVALLAATICRKLR
jgi:hypothetical protein